jgi:ABC-type microcin C transport system permease subunit YejB
MKRIPLLVSALLVLAVPAALAAPPADRGKPEHPAHPEKPEPSGKSADAPGQSADKNAAKKCKAERGTTEQSIAAFKAKYGTNGNKANAFGKCVSALSKTKDPETTSAAEKNAAKTCKAERGTSPSSIEAFKDKYGTNKNTANAFGKCVSKLAKEQGSTS